jgi:inosine-uridine nucleoside N-ribohydrolase
MITPEYDNKHATDNLDNNHDATTHALLKTNAISRRRSCWYAVDKHPSGMTGSTSVDHALPVDAAAAG